MNSVASMKDASAYFKQLPEQLEQYFDDAYQNAFQGVMDAFDEFFRLTAAIDEKAKNEHIISAEEATDIGDHGLTLLLKMVDLMEKLDLPNKRKEIEQIALIFSTWVIQYDGRINILEPIVNAFAHAANSLSSKESLSALAEIMGEVTMACSDEIRYDFEVADLYRPWRLLLVNRCIVSTRTHNVDQIRSAFDDLLRYLPQDAHGFFEEAEAEMHEKRYPEPVKELIKKYLGLKTTMRLH